jgi:Protein of unknown function (DUF1553)/Protein of unknown function (DUF1549)/Planctomycete cytochrome C
MRSSFILVMGVAMLAPASVRADETVDYLREIKPILAEKCFSCHGALKQKSDLRLDTVQAMRAGGGHGPVIVAGNSDKSLLVDHVLGRNKKKQMPPESDGEPLKPAQIAVLKRWIDQGAKGPPDEKPEVDPRDHWAFRPPVRAAVPTVKQAALVRNPIDAFIVAEWEKRGLKPQGPAEPRTLLRRVYLDLIGLPPTQTEITDFLADCKAKSAIPNPQSAIEKVVERLLASKHHGERWGRHWMDIWRYSEWYGLGPDVRNSQKHMWHWRDWIIESLNADKGYDQMVREMLAADELYPNDLDRLRGTGFLVRHYFKFNRTTWLDETIEHTGKAFLGLTLNCVKCHDHKYDPFVHADYYRFRAFFEPYQVRHDQVPGQTDFEKDGIPRAFDCNLEAPTYVHLRGDDRKPAKDKVIVAALPKLLGGDKLEIKPVVLPPEAQNPGLRAHVLENLLRSEEKKRDLAKGMMAEADKAAVPAIVKAQRALAEKMLAAVDAQIAAVKARADAEKAKLDAAADTLKELAQRAALAERRADVCRAAEDLARLDLDVLKTEPAKKADTEKKRAAATMALAKAEKALANPGENYTPLRGALKAPESNLETDASRLRPFPKTSTGRRAALARWMTDRGNPLTARVAVNHIWARHFGRPLVATVFDFGRKGSPPSHEALLDYLAVELMEHNWSMKHIHRLIVTSHVYQLTSSNAGGDVKTKEADPENRYYWRMNPVRMEAQLLRDSLLFLAGELDPALGGPSIPVSNDNSKRRSVYFVHSSNDQNKFLGVFDDASVRECYRRAESIVPQQALALANSKLALTMAAKINDRLQQKLAKASDADFVCAAFETILANLPTAEEQAECEQALREWRKAAGTRPDAGPRARRHLIHALLNHNDFITIR